MTVAAAVIVLAASYGAGFTVTAGRALAIDDPLRREATRFAFGFGVLAVAALALGEAAAFEPVVLAAIAVGFGAVGIVVAVRAARRAWDRLRRAWLEQGRHRWLLAAAAAIVVVNAVLAAAPPTSGDALAYHLTAPKLWLEAGDMFEIWWEWATFQPFSTEMHYAYAMALGSGASATLLGAGLGGYSAVCVYGLGRHLAGSTVGAVAALLWVGQGMYTWEATGGFVDLTLAAFVALAAWHLAAFARSGSVMDAGWTGLAIGLAAGTKYLGLVVVPAFALLVAAVARSGLTRRARALAAFGAFAVVGTAWYVRNVLTTGNPTYPLFYDVFGGTYWSDHLDVVFTYNWLEFGVDELWPVLIFPVQFILEPDRYERGYSYGPVLFAFAPVGLWFARRWGWVVAIGLALYVVIWWERLYQITRYLLPAVPFFTVLAALAVVKLWQGGRAARAAVVSGVVVTAASWIVLVGLFAVQILPGALRLEGEAAFVQRMTGTYDTFTWLERRLPPDGRLLIGVRNVYYLDRPYVRFYEPLFTASAPTATVVSRMRQYDVRYLAFFEGWVPDGVRAIRRQLRHVATLDVPEVRSRTLNRVVPRRLIVYEWCARRPSPACRARFQAAS